MTIQSTKYRTIQSTIQSMEKMAIKNRESCRLDWIGIPGCSIQQLLRNQKYVELTSKLIPRFRRGFLVLFITTINEKISGHTPIPLLSLFPRFQKFICMEKCFRVPEVPRFQRPRFQRFLKIYLNG